MDELNKLTIKQLQELLQQRNLSTGFKLKIELINRLYEAYDNEGLNENDILNITNGFEQEEYSNKLVDTDNLDEQNLNKSVDVNELNKNRHLKAQMVNEKLNNNTENNTNNKNQDFKMTTNNNFLFKDVEDSLTKFNGESGKSYGCWIKEFEEVAEVCEWNDIQKYLYARRLLVGAAKMAVEASKGISTYGKLKELLKKEFVETKSSIQVHKLLEKRKKKYSESYREYVYAMQTIADNSTVDEESLITYIINGIPDSTLNKTILFGATTIDDLKNKFKIYTNMKNAQMSYQHTASHQQKLATPFVGKNTIQTRSNHNQHNNTRCKNCGSMSHAADNCPNKSKGTRCFNCNEFGHISSKCPKKSSKGDKQIESVNRINSTEDRIAINIENSSFNAFIDNGSDVSLMQESVKNKIGISLYDEPGITLRGFGNNTCTTLGSCYVVVILQEVQYNIRFHIVPDSWMNDSIILGKNFLQNITLILQHGKIKILQNVKENKIINITENDIFNINVEDLNHAKNLELTIKTLNKDMKDVIIQLVNSYQPDPIEKSCVQMKIVLEDEVPVYQKARRLAPKERESVKTQIQEWLSSKIIKESESDFASPIVLVKKKDGTDRMCVDYRKLNAKIIKDRYPLPLIEDVLEKLYNAKVFTTLDLKNGFFHVDVHSNSQKYTSFITPDGQYEFLKTPFGLCNSPSMFQRFINTVFRKLIQEGFVIIYIDDLVIPTCNEEENIRILKEVLKTGKENGLLFKWEKCVFLSRIIKFLGHVIENGSVKPSEEKIKAVKLFPLPKSIKNIQSFLGLTGYFRKFIKDYAITAKPLSDLLRKDYKFEFKEDQIIAFESLKNTLCNEPVLKLFNPNLETELHTDASFDGYGGILLQKHANSFHPVFYLSFKTSPVQKNYTSYEHEVLAIIKCIEKLRVYLLGLKFKIYTDCKAFQATMNKKNICTRVARWAIMLQEFHCTVLHRSGSSMRHVDALSRYPIVMKIENGILHKIEMAQKNDEFCKLIITILQDREHDDFVLRNNILYKFANGSNLLVVPKSMQQELIGSVHNKGHINFRKVAAILNQDYVIPKLNNKIKAYINNCIACILSNRKSGKKEGFLNPIEKGDIPLHTYHIDHVGPLTTTSKNYKHLFIVIDAFTKFSWIYPVKSTTSAEVLQKLKLQANIFGNPTRIITDKGTAFTSNDFNEYCTNNKIQHFSITTGVPRGNGQVERQNATIIEILKKLSINDPAKWYVHVPRVQKIINSTINRSIGKTPFAIMFGVEMKNPEDTELAKQLEEIMIEQFTSERSELRSEAKTNILKMQQENIKNYNKKRKKSRKYKIDDMVAIQRTQFGSGLKLYPKFLGPYKITNVKRNDRYGVQKVGDHEGPIISSSAADKMKPWRNICDNDTSDFESDLESSGTDDL